jgi:phage baseplate assembly protein W
LEVDQVVADLRPSPLDLTKSFLGIGWAFPPAVFADGVIAEVAHEADIAQAIRIILGTNPGERVMRPEFGAGLRAFVFEPMSSTTLARLRDRVRESLVAWEPRIDVEQVSISRSPSELGTLLIAIEYRIRATNTRANLVYPFYLEEGTPA